MQYYCQVIVISNSLLCGGIDHFVLEVNILETLSCAQCLFLVITNNESD